MRDAKALVIFNAIAIALAFLALYLILQWLEN